MPDDDLLMTRADYERVQAEIEELETGARGEMAERIKAARELGDLKENAEYHDAKDAQAILETRILRLRDTARARPRRGGRGRRRRGRVRQRDRGRRPRHRQAARATRSCRRSTPTPPRAGVSVESPVARALVGARAGDVVEIPTPKGTRTLEVISIA